MAVIDDVIRQGQDAATRGEIAATDALVEDYRRSWTRIERELARIDRQIAAARNEAQRLVRAGNAVEARALQDRAESWLRRQQWWTEVQDSIGTELARWQGTLEATVADAQAGAVTSAARTSREIYRLTGQVWRGEVYAGAMQRWAAARSPGSPLRPIFDRYGTGAGTRIEQMITEGLGTGQGSGTIIRRIRDELGPVAQSPHLATLTRTEVHRAYRGAFQDTIEPLREQGVVTAYRWLAAKSPRTCIACLAMDGRVFDRYPMTQHVNCRCVVTPVVSREYLPGDRETPETGATWLARQPEAVQRQMFPSPDHYAAYREGKPLVDFVGIHHSDTWGDQVFIRPARSLDDR